MSGTVHPGSYTPAGSGSHSSGCLVRLIHHRELVSGRLDISLFRIAQDRTPCSNIGIIHPGGCISAGPGWDASGCLFRKCSVGINGSCHGWNSGRSGPCTLVHSQGLSHLLSSINQPFPPYLSSCSTIRLRIRLLSDLCLVLPKGGCVSGLCSGCTGSNWVVSIFVSRLISSSILYPGCLPGTSWLGRYLGVCCN